MKITKNTPDYRNRIRETLINNSPYAPAQLIDDALGMLIGFVDMGFAVVVKENGEISIENPSDG